MHPIRRSFIAALLLSTAACSTTPRPAQQLPPERGVRTDSVVVRVANRDPRPLALAVAREGVQTALGEVGANADARFAVPAAVAAGAPIALVATASRETVRTAPFSVRAGQVIWYDIAPGLVGSRARVRWPEEGRPR